METDRNADGNIDGKGIVIGRIETMTGPKNVYSPSLDSTEKIFGILSAPAADVWQKLEASGKLVVGERVAREAIRTVLAVDPNISAADLRGFLMKKMSEVGPDKPSLSRADLESAWRETLKSSANAVREVVGVLLKIDPDEAGKIVMASQIPKLVKIVTDDFDVASIRDWVDGWKAEAQQRALAENSTARTQHPAQTSTQTATQPAPKLVQAGA